MAASRFPPAGPKALDLALNSSHGIALDKTVAPLTRAPTTVLPSLNRQVGRRNVS
jgi:hypothetical protein